MQGVVPAAGEGTRLRPMTEQRPKGLVPVNGQPLLTHVFETLLEAGVDELVVVVGHLADQIIEYYGDGFREVPITYVHQREQRGLGHAVSLTEPHVSGPFVVLNGDNVFVDGIEHVLERMSEPDVDAVLAVESLDREQARDTGVLEVSAGRVTGIVEKPEKPPSTLVTTGCYVLPEAIFDALALAQPSDRGEYELSEAVGLLVSAGSVVEPVEIAGPRVNVNTEEDLERAGRLLEER
ncbi:sugar phosphate nucleotidyltransferase [Natronosalvus amylolyticus]|uniref:sugar phosphate nucleotidyltransferase n=1 Tax=Natronosalvus amylolyticus TaxID=2961994 RepID=UPI0020C9E583|nr:sugar phosphate nucleotidyltransferase [Natronosalvus amylolyticus]